MPDFSIPIRSHPIRLHRLLVAAIVSTAAIVQLAPPAAASDRPPAVPAAITVPSGNERFLVARGVGVQIYSCAKGAEGPAWKFVAPRADLFAANGKLIIKHFAGPTWQGKDGSTVVGALVAGVTVDPTAVPWLLLSAASTTAGPYGGDGLTHTTFIQRLATTGGLAPAAATCNRAAIGAQVEVPYTADYHFWKASSR
jgi:Protein of unknown function (DUF3455)